MTEKAAMRLKRNHNIVNRFGELREQYPDVSLERIFAEISKDYPLSNAAIRVICKRAEVC